MRRLAIACVVGALGFAAGRVQALDLIRDGKPAGAILVPDNASQLEQEAAQKLADYLKQASGVALPVVKESNKPEGTLISLGKTKMAAQAEINDQGLKYDGYRLIVRGGALYLLGRDTDFIQENTRVGAQGSIRAVFGLLDRLGFRWLQPTPNGTYVPQLKTVSVPDDLSVTYEPTFMYVAGRLYTAGDWSLANGFRKALKIYSQGGHTWDVSVPIPLFKDHPEYFRMQGGKRIDPAGDHQLCPSNPDVQRLILQHTLKKLAEGYDLVALGQTDGWKPCECPECRKLGWGETASDQVHIVQRKIIEECRKQYPDRFIHLLVYGPTQTPPASFKTYPPNTMAEIAPPSEENLKFWKDVVPGGATVYVYWMGTYHGIGLLGRYIPSEAAKDIEMLRRNGVKGIYMCGAGENWGTEGPTCYVLGRLADDPARNWSRELDDYCHLTFRAAGKTMRDYYDLLYGRMSTPTEGLLGEYLTGMFPPDVLERMGMLLTLAKKQAAGDERALGFIRVTEISCEHLTLMARAYHLYHAYQINPAMSNLEQVRDAVRAYKKWVGDITAIGKNEPKFVGDYWFNGGYWVSGSPTYGCLSDNLHTLASPFTWDFDALVKANYLPGKTRAKAVFSRLKAAPAIDGDPSKPAWDSAPWIDVNEVSLGKAEASTRVRLGYDDKNLYFGFECNEPKMDEMKVVEYGRKGRVYNTECVEIFLAPDGVGQKRVQFCISPTIEGAWEGRYGYIDDPLNPLVLSGAPDVSWYPKYTHAFRMDKAAKRWTIEVAIPFSELAADCPAEGTRWRGNLGRERHLNVWDPQKYPQQTELFLWAPNLQGDAFTEPAAFGDLYFGAMPDDTKK